MAPYAALCAFLLLFGCGRAAGACSNVTLFSTQLDTLLAEYDRDVQPSSPVQVEVAMEVRHATIDESTATVRLLADFKMKWEDTRLRWNASEWECDRALVSAERLWRPDVGVLSAAVRAVDAQGDTGLRAALTSDGRVAWTSRLDLSAPLELHLTDWPRDQHDAVFKFGSHSHSIDDINITVSVLKNAALVEAGAWEMVRLRSSESMWTSAGGEKPVAEWTVSLRRRAPAHALATGVVLYTSALLLVAAAMLPPASRPPLCAAASFTAALWLISALVRLPGAASGPRAVPLLGAVCACGAAAALAAAGALRVARCRSSPPHALRSLLATTALLRHLAPIQGSEECSAWAAAAQLLDALLLLVLFIAVFVIVCLYL